jgi:hypothetical protein
MRPRDRIEAAPAIIVYGERVLDERGELERQKPERRSYTSRDGEAAQAATRYGPACM